MAADAGDRVWSVHLADAVVRDVLAGTAVLRRVVPVGEVGSTQDVALALAGDGAADGTVVVADRQVAGRGRLGRRWDDRPDGGTLALTVILDVAGLPGDAVALVPHALGLGVTAACAALVPSAEPPRLKWPNDVVVRAADGGQVRKLCGVLVERERVTGPDGPRDVLTGGVGIDVDLRGGAEAPDRTCLATLAAGVPERGRLLAAVLGGLDDALRVLRRSPEELLVRYRELSDTLGRRVVVDLPGEDAIVGVATAIDGHGRLVVMTSDGASRVVLAGTVRDAPATEGHT
jgi:BirA family transcriptional regulator, biotin operon repressor / biotin---[acetyl-CoA-carboxylase] ligase